MWTCVPKHAGSAPPWIPSPTFPNSIEANTSVRATVLKGAEVDFLYALMALGAVGLPLAAVWAAMELQAHRQAVASKKRRSQPPTALDVDRHRAP